MKNYYILFISLTFTLLLSSCKSTSFSSDYDQSINFDNYRTFNFSDLSQRLPVDDIVKNRIFEAIENNLAAKGFTKSESPDLLVDLGLQLDKKKKYSSNNINLNGYFGKKRRIRIGGGKSFANEKEYTVGTLVLNFLDVTDNAEKLVWKGDISGIVKPESSNQENINSAINQILAAFPPN
jgi:hypothetical protein